MPGKLYVLKDYLIQETNCAPRMEQVRYVNSLKDEYMSGFITSGSIILYLGKSKWCGSISHKLLYKQQIVYINIFVDNFKMFTLLE